MFINMANSIMVRVQPFLRPLQVDDDDDEWGGAVVVDDVDGVDDVDDVDGVDGVDGAAGVDGCLSQHLFCMEKCVKNIYFEA